MRHAFELQVPADATRRAMAGHVAGKAVELAGGTAAEAQAFRTDVAAVVDRLAGEAPHLDLAFVLDAGRVEVAITCGGQSQVVQRHLRAGPAGPADNE